ncbi:MAG: hypothetical protein K0R38_414 [Polyangiaceae bacterium]|jgi:hypothetical protein|nr:hypothetical protein [Polyangiaceae bacterium]
MYVLRRHLAAVLALAALLSEAAPARAGWVETRPTAHAAVVDVERNGTATVTEELGIRLRGGPLAELTVAGVDGDAEPLPDATVICTDDAKFGTVPLSVTRQPDGSLKLTVERERGLRTGSYVFRFGYRTDLLKRELIRRVGSHVELRWVGPRLEDGLDSARVTFRIPEANAAPMLPSPGASGGAVNDLDELGGVFVGNLRRAPGKDELEIVRPHVARGEPALWRVWVADSAFEAFATPPSAKSKTILTTRELGEAPRERLLWLGGALLSGLAFGALLFAKWRGFLRAAELRGTEARALVPLSPGIRAALGGVLLALAVIAGGPWDAPTGVGLLLLAAMACAVLHAKPGRPQPRGPGQWLPLAESDAFARERSVLPGRYLDGTTLRGALVLGALLAGAVALHFVERRVSPYRAVELLLLSSVLLPVFLTGRARELPLPPGRDAQGVLERVLRGLRRRRLRTVPLARLPQGSTTPDELRLQVLPRSALSGLMAVEVGTDHALGVGGIVAEPYVLLRVREGSPCAAALPAQLSFQRGRKAEERVAVLRPKLPTVAETVSLVAEVCELLTQPAAKTSNRSASGKAASARKPARRVSPAHAM